MSDSKNSVAPPDAGIHKQKRALLTRQELLRSARAVFARDGFEHARLDEIASKAGKSRGAFYANFRNKEDVFFAIFEEDIDRDMAEIGSSLLGLPTIEQRLEALAEYLGRLTENRERTLLNLEFKLYAIRHPRKRRRLADLHGLMRLRCSMPALGKLIPQLGEHPAVYWNDSLAIGAILDGLAINNLFDPDAFSYAEIQRYLGLCLTAMLPQIPEVEEAKQQKSK